MNIDDLKLLPQWVGQAKVYIPEKDKFIIVPKNPRTGGNAQSNNPKTWTNAKIAWSANKRHGWDGIAYVTTIKSRVITIDLDDCFLPDGNFKPHPRDIVQMLQPTYTEFSRSGTGIHLLCRGDIDSNVHKPEEGFEMYHEIHTMHITGNMYGDSTKEIADRTQELKALYCIYTYKPKQPVTLPDTRHQTFSTDVNINDIREALNYIPKQQGYYEWLSVLMAVHDVLPNSEGVRLIENWSPGFDGEVEKKFESFDKTAKEGVTIRTLFHMAKNNGWRPRRKEYKKNNSSPDVTRHLTGSSHGRFTITN